MQNPPSRSVPQGQTEAVLVRYWYILKKRRLVVATFAIGLFVSVTIATMLATPYYSSTAEIEITPKAPTVIEVNQVQDLVTAASSTELRNYYATQYKIIQSRSVLQEALQTLREEHGITDFDDADKPVEAFKRHLTVEPVMDTHLVDIRFEYPDPKKAALFANAVAKTYIKQNLARAIESTRQALSGLRAQFKVYRDKRRNSDLQVHKFKSENGLVGGDDMLSSREELLKNLQKAWSDAATARIQAQAVYERLANLARSQDWAPIAQNLATEHPVLQELLAHYNELEQERTRLKTRYTDDWPEVKKVNFEIAGVEKQIRAQVADIVAGKKAEVEVLKKKEDDLAAALDEAKAEVEELDKKRIDLQALESDAKRNDALSEALDKRLSEVDLSQVLKANNVRIIDEAVPGDKPVRPVLPVNLAMALVLGLLGGCGLAFLLEYLDVTVKTREEIENIVGIPMLGIVPTVDEAELNELSDPVDRAIFAFARPRSPTAECLRSIRANVGFRLARSNVTRLLITSAAPREGKSFNSANLAAIFALGGKRVLLIDADLRRPSLHQRFGLSDDLGLSDILTGRATAEQVIQRTHVPHLDVIVAGHPPPSPGELLGTAPMKRLLNEIRGYDMIVVDSPPVNMVADPLVLSSMVDGVLLVIEANRTNRNLVVQANARLVEMDANVLGAIVNKLDVRHSGYGYYYYYDSYGYYYGSDEPAEPQELGA